MSILDKITGFFGAKNEKEDNVGDPAPAEPAEGDAPVINPEPEVPEEKTPSSTPEMPEGGGMDGAEVGDGETGSGGVS